MGLQPCNGACTWTWFEQYYVLKTVTILWDVYWNFCCTPSILDRIPLDPCFLTLIAWKWSYSQLSTWRQDQREEFNITNTWILCCEDHLSEALTSGMQGHKHVLNFPFSPRLNSLRKQNSLASPAGITYVTHTHTHTPTRFSHAGEITPPQHCMRVCKSQTFLQWSSWNGAWLDRETCGASLSFLPPSLSLMQMNCEVSIWIFVSKRPYLSQDEWWYTNNPSIKQMPNSPLCVTSGLIIFFSRSLPETWSLPSLVIWYILYKSLLS